MTELEPLSPELDALLETERSAPPPNATMQAEVLKTVLYRLSPTPAVGGSIIASKAIGAGVIFGLGLATGALGHQWLFSEKVSHSTVGVLPVSPTTSGGAVSASPAPESPPLGITLPLAPPSPARAAAATRAQVPPAGAPTRAEDAAEERLLISQAQAALGRALYDEALLALDQHREKFPTGKFCEERDALRVRTLIGAKRTLEGAAEARLFIAKYPSSLSAPAMRAFLAGLP